MMLALSDEGLARLVIAAGRVPAKSRRRWLAEFAAKLEGRDPFVDPAPFRAERFLS